MVEEESEIDFTLDSKTLLSLYNINHNVMSYWNYCAIHISAIPERFL